LGPQVGLTLIVGLGSPKPPLRGKVPAPRAALGQCLCDEAAALGYEGGDVGLDVGIEDLAVGSGAAGLRFLSLGSVGSWRYWAAVLVALFFGFVALLG